MKSFVFLVMKYRLTRILIKPNANRLIKLNAMLMQNHYRADSSSREVFSNFAIPFRMDNSIFLQLESTLST